MYEMFVGRKLWPFSCKVEISTIVIKTDNIDILQIFPCPVMTGKLTEMRVF